MELRIKNARLFDPANGVDEKGTLNIKDGRVVKNLENPEEEINADGLILIPGLIDIHSHFREPGDEDAETIRTGSMAAVRGGYSSVCVMPNTDPPIDNEGVARFIKEKSEDLNLCRVYPVGTITKGREGKELSEMTHLIEAGCVAFSDDGNCVEDSSVLRNALEYSKLFNVPIIEHPEDFKLTEDGQMHEGIVSTQLGLKGIPDIAESSIVIRDILLSNYTSGKLHFAHISSSKSIKIINDWKNEKITAEVTPHHLLLTDESVRTFDTNTKMKPPLRTREDINSLQKALKEGVIDIIATDHAPHPDYRKELEYTEAAYGIIGLETAFPIIYTELVENDKLDFETMILALTRNPSSLMQIPVGEIKEGGTADFTLVDTDYRWTIQVDEFASKSKNSPFIGRSVKGRVRYTIVNGNVVYREGDFTG